MQQTSPLLSANVPRYTSYPTAPHFHAGINSARYRDWLGTLPENAPLSLYLHIPFCDTLCWFCGCNTTAVNTYSPVRSYCDMLLKEIGMVSAALNGRRPVSHIHWGGGSPTLLSTADIARLNDALRENFDVLPDAEFAVEIDPRGFNHAMAQALKAAGVTRASIGLQDCDPAVQHAINRIQSDEETAHAIELLREAGISSLNLDLIYGLPRQTLASWERTLDFALWLNPDRFAVFGYAHVPQFKKHQALIPVELLPGVDLRLQQAELAREILCAHGYAAIGLDHFAKSHDSLARAAADGSISRNFQGYTTDSAPILIGLGASAIGSLPQGYAQNHPQVPAWRGALEAGNFPVARGIALTDNDRMHRHVIERLMCDLEVDLADVAAMFGRTPVIFAESLRRLAPIEEEGMVAIKGAKVTVKPQWRSAVRLVCAAFDQYLDAGQVRHSVSV